jgi:hypothetical protein
MADTQEFLPKSLIGKAATYTINQWNALNGYLEDGDLSIDNNAAERAMKPVAIGRKNWLFVGSPAAGRPAAILLSLIASCKPTHNIAGPSPSEESRSEPQIEICSSSGAYEGHVRILNRYLKPDLLILDDMDMKHLPKKIGEFLFEIIIRRHELRSTMMTSNRPLEDWGKLIGDVSPELVGIRTLLRAIRCIAR